MSLHCFILSGTLPPPPAITTTFRVQHLVEEISSASRFPEIYTWQQLPHRALTCTRFPHLTAVSWAGVVGNYRWSSSLCATLLLGVWFLARWRWLTVPPQTLVFFMGETRFHCAEQGSGTVGEGLTSDRLTLKPEVNTAANHFRWTYTHTFREMKIHLLKVLMFCDLYFFKWCSSGETSHDW